MHGTYNTYVKIECRKRCKMTTAQVTLSESESHAIQALSQRRGKTQEEILHQAIQQFLTQHQTENRLAALRQARGVS